jgi:hypothetical protein
MNTGRGFISRPFAKKDPVDRMTRTWRLLNITSHALCPVIDPKIAAKAMSWFEVAGYASEEIVNSDAFYCSRVATDVARIP